MAVAGSSAMFNRRKKDAPPAAADEGIGDEADDKPDAPEPDDAQSAKPKAAGRASRTSGWLGLVLGVGTVTLAAVGVGAGLGMQTASTIERTIAERAPEPPVEEPARPSSYGSDIVLQAIEAVVTNLAEPADIWIRLETAIVFKNGAVENPAVVAAEIQQDILAYARTVSLAQLEGPSALQHLREDLNERVSVRTDGRVKELIIQSLVVQ